MGATWKIRLNHPCTLDIRCRIMLCSSNAIPAYLYLTSHGLSHILTNNGCSLVKYYHVTIS